MELRSLRFTKPYPAFLIKVGNIQGKMT